MPHVDRQEVCPNQINVPRLFPLLQHEWNLVASALTTRQSNECFGPAPTWNMRKTRHFLVWKHFFLFLDGMKFLSTQEQKALSDFLRVFCKHWNVKRINNAQIWTGCCKWQRGKGKKKEGNKTTLTEYWHGNEDNFTSAMYTRHIFETDSPFASADVKWINKNVAKWRKTWGSDKAAE